MSLNMKKYKVFLILIMSLAFFTGLSAQTYSVSLSNLPTDGGTTTGAGTYPTGTLVTIEATPNIGFEFQNWTSGADVISADSSYSFLISNDTSLVANYTKKKYIISSSVSPIGSGTTSGDGTFEHGTSIELIAFPAEGYSFVNWTEGPAIVSTDSSYTFVALSNRSLTANFVLKTYNILLSSEPENGGVVSGGGSYTHGDSVKLDAIPNTGYNFVNWTENNIEQSQDSNYSFLAISDRNLLANFSLKNFTISATVLPVGSGNVLGDSTYLFGASATLIARASAGYTFVNWTEGGTSVSTDTNYTFTVTEDRNLVANFALDNYLITTTSNPPEGGVSTGGGSYNYGQPVTISAIPADGYVFTNWTESDTLFSQDSVLTFSATKSLILVANYGYKQYSVTSTVSPIGSGTTTGDSSYSHGTMATLTATPNLGWNFDDWTKNGQVVSMNNIYSFVVLQNTSLAANFSKKEYNLTLSVQPTEGGITTGSGIYSHDSVAVIVATPNEGWSFVNWTENTTVISTDSLFSLPIISNRTLVANFTKKTYKITTQHSPNEGGATSGDSTYTHGDIVTVTARPNSDAGWDFIGWTENGNFISSEAAYSFTATQVRTLVANFQLREYTLDLLSNPSDGGFVQGEGNYTHGDSVEVVATPGAGWLFANWTDGVNNVSSSTRYKFEITKNTSLTANFAHELYSVVGYADPAEAGFVSGTGSFFFGQTATLTPVANDGWEFEKWMDENQNILSTDSIYSFDVNGSLNIIAKFKLRNYLIDCTVNPEDAGFTSGCGLSFFNQEISLSATANNGWEFVNWTENGNVVSTSPDYIFTVSKNRNLVANFDFISGIELLDEISSIPENYYLSNPYPNPFNPSTRINFGLPETSSLKIVIANINGQIVSEVLKNAILPAGNYSSTFESGDLSSGIYFYIIYAQSQNSSKNFKKVGKLILLK